MPFLAQALNSSEMAARFVHEFPCLATAEHVDVLGISVTRYKPGRRCLIVYDIAMQEAGGMVGELAVVGKVRARSADTSTHDLMQRLWAGSFGASSDDGIVIPEPLGIVRDVHMGVQRWVSGESLTGLLEGPSGLRLARRTAEAIHKLHLVSAPARRRHTVDDEIRILGERLASVAQDNRHWQARIERLFEGCMRLATRVREGPVCGIHRDFYPDQLLADGDRLYMLDFDLYSEGHPALDIGNFLAHVDEYSLRRFGDPEYLADRKELMIDRYLQLSGAITREAIRIWTALSLTRHLAISRLFPERRPFTEALLAVCEDRVLSESKDGRKVGPA
jgi:hypothetical protein